MDLAECDLKSAMADGVVTVDDMIDLLGSLQKIHDLGIVHRDIKPENILKVGGRWKFSDFGLSRSLRSISISGSIAGTPEYMSPEQFLPRRLGPVDARTDIWQMGILAYHVIVGRSPYLSDDPEEKMMIVVSEGPDLDAVPEPYAPVISRALSFDRSERFQSAREFAEALRDARAGGRIALRRRARERSRKRRCTRQNSSRMRLSTKRWPCFWELEQSSTSAPLTPCSNPVPTPAG